jgi:site-specific DNA recombinase
MTTTAAPLRAGLYSRESKDKTKSIDDQAEESREAAADRGWLIVDEYTDGVSASRFGSKVRKGWRRLLEDLDARALDVVVAWEPSRADRDLETWVSFVSRCRTRSVLVHLTGDGDTLDPRNPSHWHRLITGGVDAAMESEKISKRVRRGIGRAAVAGTPHGRVPYGYERVIVGERPTPHGPKPVKEQRKNDKALFVAEIFDRIARLDPIVAIVRDLKARNVAPPEGGTEWTRHAVRIIARNVAYIGRRRHRSTCDGEEPTDALYEATWPPIVEERLFYRVQDVLDRPDRKTTKPGKARWMMSYIAASPCGDVMQAKPDGTGNRYACRRDRCVTVPVGPADEVVSMLIVARLCQADVRDLFTPDDGAGRAAKAEAEELRARLDRHYDEAADGRLSAGGLAAMEKRLLPLIADADRRSKTPAASGAMALLLDAAEFGVTRVRPVWDGLPVAARREVIPLLAEVLVGKSARRMSRWSSEQERMTSAAAQLAGSRWVGDERTWGELGLV